MDPRAQRARHRARGGDEVASLRGDVLFTHVFDFYLGFGLSISVILVCLAFLLWQLGAMANADAAMLRPSVFALALMFVALSVLDCICFFPRPPAAHAAGRRVPRVGMVEFADSRA